jgi:hypothetical protein
MNDDGDYISLRMMRDMFWNSPRAMHACRAEGIRPGWVLQRAIDALAGASQRQRDVVFTNFARAVGADGVNSEADMLALGHQWAERASGELARIEPVPFAPKLTPEEQARYFANLSRQSSTTWTANGLMNVGDGFRDGFVTQKLNRRLAARDGPASDGVAPQYRDEAEQSAVTRARMGQMLSNGETHREAGYEGKRAEDASLRDLVEFNYERDEARAEREEAERDPIEDLAGWSNTIVTGH